MKIDWGLGAEIVLKSFHLWNPGLEPEAGYRNPGIEWDHPLGNSGLMNRAATFDSGIAFVEIELQIGMTFASIAANARDENKFNRNRENAKRAYRTALYFMNRFYLTEAHSAEFHKMLEELERNLRTLEEPGFENRPLRPTYVPGQGTRQ